jgi:death-on-curing protein
VSLRVLSGEEVMIIHADQIRRFGGLLGVRDRHGFEAALARPQAGFGDQEFYPTLSQKAAALLHGLVKNHPFVDGSKRTGFLAARVFLAVNGVKIASSDDEDYELVIAVAEGRMEVDEIARWFEDHTAR